MIVDELVAGVAVLLWVVVLAKARGTLMSGAPPARWLLACLTSLAVGATFFVSAVGRAVEGALGPQLQEPVARTAVLLSAFCAQTLLVLLTRGHRSRRERWLDVALLATAVAVLWVTFSFGPATPTARFGSRAEADVSMNTYLLVFLLYLGQSVARVLVGTLRYSSRGTSVMRHGLRLIAAGCATGLGYIGVKLAAVVLLYANAPISYVTERTAGRTLAVLAGTLVAIGACLPTLSEWWGDARGWWFDYRAHRDLYPLWSCLTAAAPTVALDPPSGRLADALRVRQMHLRLYRRLIELRDARLVLRPAHGATAVGTGQAPLAADDAGAAMWSEAAALRAALADAGRRHPDEELMDVEPVGDSIADELAWWSGVARAFAAQQREATRDDPALRGVRAA